MFLLIERGFMKNETLLALLISATLLPAFALAEGALNDQEVDQSTYQEALIDPEVLSKNIDKFTEAIKKISIQMVVTREATYQKEIWEKIKKTIYAFKTNPDLDTFVSTLDTLCILTLQDDEGTGSFFLVNLDVNPANSQKDFSLDVSEPTSLTLILDLFNDGAQLAHWKKIIASVSELAKKSHPFNKEVVLEELSSLIKAFKLEENADNGISHEVCLNID